MNRQTPLAAADPCTIVIFGASGDLTKRLLVPALGNLDADHLLPEQLAVIGVSRSNPDEKVTSLRGYRQVAGDFEDAATWERLREELARAFQDTGSGNCLFYLATAPEQFLSICERLAALHLLAEDQGVAPGDRGEAVWTRPRDRPRAQSQAALA